jgi:DNA mismatch repair protein MutH
VVLRALKAHCGFIPAKRGILVRARQVEGIDFILVADEDYFVVAIDLRTVRRWHGVREHLTPGNRGAQDFCGCAADRKTERDCAQRKRRSCAKKLASVGNQGAASAIRVGITI